jgi:hypothetical protein
MAATAVVPPQDPQAPPLSEGARLLNTFFAPRKTFTDLRRSASWWAPFLITSIVSLLFVYVVDQKIGFRKVTENQIQSQPKQAERIEGMPADQREKVIGQQVSFTRAFSYGFFLFVLFWYALVAAVLLATLKFAAGADVKFKTLFALVFYAGIPGLVKSLLAILSLLAGASGDGFTFQNPVATNPGYFVDHAAHPVLAAFLTPFDVTVFWVLAIAAIGITCISKVKSGTAYAIVFGWYAVLIVVGVGFAAAFS